MEGGGGGGREGRLERWSCTHTIVCLACVWLLGAFSITFTANGEPEEVT